MKLFTLMFIGVFIGTVHAEDCKTSVGTVTDEAVKVFTTDTPKHLKGAVIIVRLADGKESVVPAEQFKVVPRKYQEIVTSTRQDTTTVCKVKADQLKNRVSLLGGYGPKAGLTRTLDGPTTTVETQVGGVGGVQYQRLITDRISVGVEGQSNETTSISIGLDF